LGQSSKVKHHIDTEIHVSIRNKLKKTEPYEEKVIRIEVESMLKEDIIWKSKLVWTVPVLLVDKPNKSIRFCVNYRKLNEISKKDVYSLLKIDNILNWLTWKKYYITIDLASRYWQIEIEEKNKEKSAFICCAELFEFNMMLFGLINALATFQKMMDEIIEELGLQAKRNYMNDIIIESEIFKEHLEDLERIFIQLKKVKLRIKPNKCHFLKNNVISWIINYKLKIKT
jgi:hypothetical protein